MKIQTKRNILRAATAAAVACAAAVVFLPATASAAPATATTSVNVRSGPGTSFGVVDTLRAGQTVEVLGCRSGWCYVEKSGPDGYVSSSYLRRGGGGGGATFEPNFNLSFNFPSGGGISIGTDGVNIGIGRPGPGPGRPGPGFPGPGPGPGFPGGGGSLPGDVCFYSEANFRGDRFCADEGDSIRFLGRWDDRISSIRNPDRYDVTVCADAGFRDCRTYRTDARSLGGFDDEISSIRIR